MLHIWLQHLSLLFTCSGSLMAEKICKWRYLAFTGNSSILLARMGLLCYLVYNDSTVKQPQLAEVNTKEVSLPASLQSPTFTDSFGNGCHFTCLVYHSHSSWLSLQPRLGLPKQTFLSLVDQVSIRWLDTLCRRNCEQQYGARLCFATPYSRNR